MATTNWFGTDGIRGRFGSDAINPLSAVLVGYAAGRVLLRYYSEITTPLQVDLLQSGQSVLDSSLPNKNNQAEPDADAKNSINLKHSAERHAVVIGCDTRASGPVLEHALASGFAAAGLDVFLVGVAATPLVAQLTRELSAVAGIVVSASHNSYQDNGIKFFDPYGFKISDQIEEAISELIQQQPSFNFETANGKIYSLPKHIDKSYRAICNNLFPKAKPLSGLKILVDCANGAFYSLAPDVLSELGAEVIKIACEPSGININDQCGAVFPETLRMMMITNDADIGIAFDGDGDRLWMADKDGVLYDGDSLLYVLVTNPRQGQSIDGVVGTQMTNLGLEQALAAKNIAFVRAAVGDRYVMAELRKRGWQCGGENSGHLLDLGIATTGDGLLSALNVLRVLTETGSSLASLTAEIQHCQQTLVNIRYEKIISLQHPLIMQAVEAAEATLQDKGRVLLRFSGTEPLVRVMIEGHDAELNEIALQKLTTAVKQVIAETGTAD